MRKAVQMTKLVDGTFRCIPLEEFLFENQICKIIDQKHGWWIHEKEIPGGASDGIGAEVIVRDFTPADYETIQASGGKCWVEVNHRNELICPKNGRGNMKIVLFLHHGQN